MKLLTIFSSQKSRLGLVSNWSVAFIIALISCTWLGSINNGFLWDDHVLIEENSQFFRTLPLLSWFTADFWNTPTIGRFSGYYRPLVSLSFVFDFLRSGLAPESFHLTNIALHLLVSVCLWRLLRVLAIDPIASLYATLLFGIHPIQTQGVAWISGRADILASLGIVSCVLFFIMLLRDRKSPRILWGVLAILGYALALFSKESAIVTIPILLVVLRHECGVSKRAFRDKNLAIFSLTLLFLSIGWMFSRSVAVPKLNFIANFSTTNVLVIILDLIGGILWPFNFRIDYSIAPSLISLLPNPIAGLIILSLLLIAITLHRKHAHKTLQFFAQASLFSLLPAIIAVSMLSVAGARMMYLSTLFIFPFLVLLLRKRVSSKRFHIISLSFITICALSSLRQVELWRSDISLFTHALIKQGSHDVAHLNLGIAKYESGDFTGAAVHLSEEMLKKGEDQRHYMLGVISLALDCEETAESEFRLAIEKNARFYAAYHNLAGLFANQGRISDALELFESFKITSPQMARQIANDQYAIGQLKKHATRKPRRQEWCNNQTAREKLLESPEALLNRAVYFLKARQLHFARIFARATLRVAPEMVSARLIEAQVNYRLGYRKEALEALEKIDSIDVRNREVVRRLRQSLVDS